jgi:hypothetical protein
VFGVSIESSQSSLLVCNENIKLLESPQAAYLPTSKLRGQQNKENTSSFVSQNQSHRSLKTSSKQKRAGSPLSSAPPSVCKKLFKPHSNPNSPLANAVSSMCVLNKNNEVLIVN